MARKDDKQMEMLFEEGGIADDGMSVDPVSGNEVPAGSMASEVRDDVPAQLSEGEYVVPADVTRYYGVKFFEDLRRQAKMGLGEMEQDGRIGGEPVAVDEGILTPEEEAVLGMAMGGMVEKQGYNEGGTVAGNVAPNYTMANYLFGTGGTGSFGTDTTATPDTTEDRAVTLYGPDGSTVSLVLPAQQAEYDNYMRQGYSETQDVVAQQTASAFGGGDGDGGGGDDASTSPGGTGNVSSYGEMPSYGLGAIGGTLAGTGLGLLTTGLTGAAKGAKEGREADNFNNARNDLVSAMESYNKEAIDKAKADIAKAYEGLGGLSKVAVFDEGKNAEEAIKNVEDAVYEARQQQAQASAQASLERAREKAASDTHTSAAEEAREAAARNEAAGLGAQTKAGSMAGTKSGYFDSPSDDSGGGGGGDSCFLAGTPVTMANGIQKAIEDIQLNDKLEGGGRVFALGQFLNDEIFDYKGVLVSGSHLVKENGKWLRVRDSDLASPHSHEVHKVYVLGTENHVIEIQGITFSDYFEAHTQELLLEHQDVFMDFYKSGEYNKASRKLREEAVNNGDVQ